VISGSGRDVDETLVLLGHYAVNSGFIRCVISQKGAVVTRT